MSTKEEIARLLISLGCLQISPKKPFTYASGLKGPIYCDNRQILYHVKERESVFSALIGSINNFDQSYDLIAGLATAGIPHAAVVSYKMDLPMIYVRSKKKGHGKGNQVEGYFNKGQKVILIEDLVNQASSLELAVNGVNDVGLIPVACFCVVDYEMSVAKDKLKKIDIPLFSLTDFTTISKIALEDGQISKDEFDLLIKWHKDPANWIQK